MPTSNDRALTIVERMYTGSMHDALNDDWPNGSEQLFVLGDAWANACLNPWWRSFDSDARNFFRAARTLVQAACDESGGLDTLVNPIVVSYRHGLELYIKAVIGGINELESDRASVPGSHNLAKLWRKALRLVRQHYREDAPDELEHVTPIVEQFMRHDPGATAFRYPRALDGSLVLREITHINLAELASVMQRVENVFDCLTTDLAEKLDYVQQAQAEYSE